MAQEQTRRWRRSTKNKAIEVKGRAKSTGSEDCAFNSEERSHRTTASKSLAKPVAAGTRDTQGTEVSEEEFVDEEFGTEEEPAEEVENERESKAAAPVSPGSPSVRDKKRSRRTRSRSRRRHRRREDGGRRREERSPLTDREELERAREGQSSSARAEEHPRPTRRPSRSLQRKPRSPDYPPPSKGKGRGRGWKGYPLWGGSPRPDWTNKGVKKVGRQIDFKEYLAYKKQR